MTANAVSITVKPTRIIERKMARGVEVRASAVSSETCEQASKPRKAQPPTAIAVRKPDKYELSVPGAVVKPSSNNENEWLRKNTSNNTPITTDAMTSAMMPALTKYFSGLIPNRFTPSPRSNSTAPLNTCALAEGASPVKNSHNQNPPK
ncbi:hypothetical protein D3C80_1201130 [compost metagenome]